MGLKPDKRMHTVTMCESIYEVALMLPDPLHEIRCHPDIKRAIVPIYRDSQECRHRAASSLVLICAVQFAGLHNLNPNAEQSPHRRLREEIPRSPDFASLLDSGPECSPGQAFRRNDGEEGRDCFGTLCLAMTVKEGLLTMTVRKRPSHYLRSIGSQEV